MERRSTRSEANPGGPPSTIPNSSIVEDSKSVPGFAEPLDLHRFEDVLAVVLLPTLNEEAGLARTLRDLPTDRFEEPGRRIQTLIIDGGSTDGTLDVARAWGVPVLRQTSRGKGGAMIEAIDWIHAHHIPFVLVLDADATYPPDRILPALELLAGGTHLVVGVRRPVWGPPSDLKDLTHRAGNLALSYAASVLSRRPILDLCSGFWGVSTQRFVDLGLGDVTFAIEAELVLRSIRRGYSIHQFPVTYHERLGVAKLRAVRDGTRILRTIVREARPGPTEGRVRRARGSWSRDVLSIGLALGGPGPTLEITSPAAEDAEQIAGIVHRTFPGAQVHVRPGRSFSVRQPVGIRGRSPPDGMRDALNLSLPAPDPVSDATRSAIVSIQSARRWLTVELPPEPTGSAAESTAPVWSRSGGWVVGRFDHRRRASSLLVVTSRLNFRPEHQQETLLAANGFHVVDSLRSAGRATLGPASPDTAPRP
ncbi:MAG: glycosyltransferase family 2 protein [Thermoplasmata archaeon]|nr:glycosyltransferase family 2 protein [Thermoplasmata archaeon]